MVAAVRNILTEVVMQFHCLDSSKTPFRMVQEYRLGQPVPHKMFDEVIKIKKNSFPKKIVNMTVFVIYSNGDVTI